MTTNCNRPAGSAIVNLLAFTTTEVAEAVPQSLASYQFEEASEFGVPKAGAGAEALLAGYTFEDHDLATRYTWKFLRDEPRRQIDQVWNNVMEADNRLVPGTILQRLFTPTERVNEQGNRVFGLWNGTDGLAPLPHLALEFDSSTAHYIASGQNIIDSQDIEDAVRMITKGYGRVNNARILILANPIQAEAITTWRAGKESRVAVSPETSGLVAKWDFVPSTDAPPYLTDQNIVGQVAPAEFAGLKVLGSYGEAWVIPSNLIPQGYVAVVATSGPNSTANAVGVRIHPNSAYQGLRLIPGRDQRYPLIEAYAARSFGVGVRHRSSAVCIRLTTGSYTGPTGIAV